MFFFDLKIKKDKCILYIRTYIFCRLKDLSIDIIISNTLNNGLINILDLASQDPASHRSTTCPALEIFQTSISTRQSARYNVFANFVLLKHFFFCIKILTNELNI